MKMQEIIDEVAGVTGQSKKSVREVYNALVEVVASALADKEVERLPLTGLVTFTKVAIPERNGRNPQTGETITIPAHTRLKAKPVKVLATMVRNQ